MTLRTRPMHRYIAFLRAINVGGHTVKMAHLRSLFEEMGFEGVETFIASGNVIFRSPGGDAAALEERIERHLQRALGFEVGTFLRSDAELAAIAAYQPFDGREGHTLSVTFLKAPPGEEARERIAALRTGSDDFHVQDREVYWLCQTRMSDSPAGALLGRAIREPGTMRNLTTVRKLAAKYVPAL